MRRTTTLGKPYWQLKLTWRFKRRGLKTHLTDPLNPRENIRLVKLEMTFLSQHTETYAVHFRLYFTGELTKQLRNREIDEVYGFIHDIFNKGLSTFDDKPARAEISTTYFCAASANSWNESAIKGLSKVMDKIGLSEIPGKPEIEGDAESFVLSLFENLSMG